MLNLQMQGLLCKQIDKLIQKCFKILSMWVVIRIFRHFMKSTECF